MAKHKTVKDSQQVEAIAKIGVIPPGTRGTIISSDKRQTSIQWSGSLEPWTYRNDDLEGKLKPIKSDKPNVQTKKNSSSAGEQSI